MKVKRINEKIDEIIEFSGIEHHIDTPVKRYSSGMYVRLAFAVAAHLDSDILIADEVLAVGDAEFQKKALGKMQDLSTGEGRTVLFVSHNMSAVKSLCNVGIVLDKGKLTYNGEINDCIEKYINRSDIFINSVTTMSFNIDESKPFQIIKLEILNDRNEHTYLFERTNEIIIRLFCISRIPIPNMYGYISIKNNNGFPIIICDSREDGNDIFNSMRKNSYTIDLCIPSCILAAGEYISDICFGSGNYKDFYIEEHRNIIKFKIKDSFSIRGNTRNSLTSLILNWKIRNED
jgi:lipopolysaccharide transport system ATP-binding protein